MFLFRRFISFLFYIGVLCQSAFAALPGVEAPQSSGGSGIMGQFKGYLQDGIVLGGLLVAAIMFINVAIAAGHTFAEVRNERATWTKFGAIVVVGAILLVIIIWLLGKSANIIL
ncbi:putative membrane protein [Pectobacterium atrosepticum SCRI1043]|uniref:Membrane protein n=2 Tax=Pectobacterium atrosepticum TaxID=29471 RepID=Q6D9P9_PECAS|nr:TIGR03745 family integrating conjugative element membrane protein [Pectobacterium atrosepticum]GKV85778.1 integrating conjugative element membrane protein [Pectobacterium carotovorum subsp. carotovorum]AFH56857.1 hypothetical protein KCQ_13065 [Pectobacterium atrosepticum]AIA69899.1 membrane protein [Pectobacterium atrosepticum]AIK12814.1 putative membrane protein [Pectobacterium atrosepticum]ATY89392.1 TIGR03745 family integrating conjugative element membrane protein [Pectobacterium atrose